MGYGYASGVISRDVNEVWGLVRRFDALPLWHPAVAECAMLDGASPTEVGARRRQVLADGRVAVARLVSLDDDARALCYEMLDGPWPVRHYVSSVRIAPVTSTGHAFVEWWGRYDADLADEPALQAAFERGVYDAGVRALQEHFVHS